MAVPEITSPGVADVFDALEPAERRQMQRLRQMIYQVAEELEAAGEIEEGLKWGQPSYQTLRPKSGTPLRLAITKDRRVGVFAHCQTTVMSDIAALIPDTFEFDGNRAVLFDADAELPEAALRLLIQRALLYHV